MPVRSALTALPAAKRRELDRRLLHNGFAGYAELSQWLKDSGHQVGKSAIGDYAKANRARIVSAAVVRAQGLGESSLRAMCLLAAAFQGQTASEDVVARADRFLSWALTGR